MVAHAMALSYLAMALSYLVIAMASYLAMAVSDNLQALGAYICQCIYPKWSCENKEGRGYDGFSGMI